MKNIFWLVLIFIYFFKVEAWSQLRNVKSSPYLDKMNYIPCPGSANDIEKTVHLAIHIWQRADGSGNIHNSAQFRQRLTQIMFWLNEIYNTNPPQIPRLSYAVDTLNDSKLQFKLDHVYYYRDASLDSSYSYTTKYMHNIFLNEFLAKNYPDRTRTLNIHIFRGEFAAAGYSGGGSIGTFYRYNPEMDTSNVHDYWFAVHLAHELGHGFDLWHTYNTNSAYQQNCQKNFNDFLYDVYDTTLVSHNEACDAELLTSHETNNLMGGGRSNFISALQMGIANRCTVVKNIYNVGFNMRDYVTGYGHSPKIIDTNQTWDVSMKIYQDIVVKEGVTLLIKSEIQMVPKARLFIENGAKVIIEKGGKLTNERYYNTNWKGVFIKKTSKNGKLKAGILIVEDGGEVLFAKKIKKIN